MRKIYANKINLLDRLNENIERDEQIKRKLLFLTPFISIIVLVIIFEIVFHFLILAPLEDEYDSLYAYVHDEANLASYEEAQALAAQRNALASEIRAYEELFANISSYPDLNKEIYSTVISRATLLPIGVTDISYERESGLLTLECITYNQLLASEYVSSLRSSGLFLDLDYHGYQRQSWTDDPPVRLSDVDTMGALPRPMPGWPPYAFSINCRLAGKAVAESE